MLIFRRSNCIITASGIVTLCKRLYIMPVESSLLSTGILYIPVEFHGVLEQLLVGIKFRAT